MTRRLLMVLSVFILVEFAVFYWRHHDMVRLSLSRETVIGDPGFSREAASVLDKRSHQPSRARRIADVAEARGEQSLQIQALERIVSEFPQDPVAASDWRRRFAKRAGSKKPSGSTLRSSVSKRRRADPPPAFSAPAPAPPVRRAEAPAMTPPRFFRSRVRLVLD